MSETTHSDPSCPEDPSIKMEPSNRCEEVHSNAMSNKEMRPDKATGMVQVGSISDARAFTKPLPPKASATAGGKKLRCPFCERLCVYETILRAHIRRRHKGIRVPCPFCTRTFSRNNSVRRHIASEHKPELREFQQPNQVHNHAQNAAVDVDNNRKIMSETTTTHSDPSCPEDPSLKMEPSNRCEEVHSNTMSYKEKRADKAPGMVQVGSISDAFAFTKPLPPKASAIAGGLKCPFCERLFGYETILRAHIRQRHEGIRVPCPFCTRTFSRIHSVRRHIAREHMAELSLRAFKQPNPVQNHAQ